MYSAKEQSNLMLKILISHILIGILNDLLSIDHVVNCLSTLMAQNVFLSISQLLATTVYSFQTIIVSTH